VNSQIVAQYRRIIKEDGELTKEELIEMLNADIEIQTDNYDELAEQILNYKRKTYIRINRKLIDDERYELYRKGLTDQEIADNQKVCKNSVWAWRYKRNLPANNPYTKIYKERFDLYYQGFTDKEIAEKLNSKQKTIRGWRNKNKLLSNSVAKPQIANEIAEKEKRRMAMVQAGMTAKEIAKKECVTKRAIETYLYRRNKCTDATNVK